MLDRAALILALVTPASPVAASPTALPSAQLEASAVPARGAAAEVRYTTTCPADVARVYTLRMTLAQRTGHTVAVGSAQLSNTCTGLRQALTLRAGAGASFRPGRAWISSCLWVHNAPPSPVTGDPPCSTGSRTEIVTLTGP